MTPEPGRDQVIKQAEWWRLLRFAGPLIAAGLGVAWLYTYLGFSAPVFWVGPPLALTGSVCAAIGYRRRLREIASPDEPTARHYSWLLTGGALILAGLLIPPYTAG